MTKELNRDRFNKLIALAESDHDAEALAAVRRAAVMARAAGMSLGQAVASGTGADTTPSLRLMTVEMELAGARLRIADLERRLAAGADQAALEEAHIQGYRRGHRAGVAEAEREARMKADRRIREVEAELEAYRQPLDWLDLAERFAHKDQRGTLSAYAKGILLRARTNKLLPEDQATLRKFSTKKTKKTAA